MQPLKDYIELQRQEIAKETIRTYVHFYGLKWALDALRDIEQEFSQSTDYNQLTYLISDELKGEEQDE